jgi:two-component system phosphate regulon response regulator PhoB
VTPPTPAGERVLVVDDEPDIVALVAYHLAKAGYRVATASSGTDALESVRRERPALLVLDLMLPGMSGYDVLEQLRADEVTRDVAILLLTARREEPDRIHGLSLGADDYLTKPFSLDELTARMRALLRRDIAREDNVLRHRELTLAERRGRVQARAHLLETVWEAAPDIQTRTVDMHVQRLRAKLGAAGDMIETVRGFGYRLRVPHGRPT